VAYQSALGKLKDSEDRRQANLGRKGWQGQSSAIYQQLLQQKLDAMGGEQVMRKLLSVALLSSALAYSLTGCSTLED
jgi:hypothetical protein